MRRPQLVMLPRAAASVCRFSIFCLLTLSAGSALAGDNSDCWPGFVPHSDFDEQVREIQFASQCRAIVVAPDAAHFRCDRATRLVIYATPNGNTIEQTLGCRAAEGLDWHFDIQHAAAQVRACRDKFPKENLVLACIQPHNRSWPTWRRNYAESDRLIKDIVSALAGQIPPADLSILLTGHSGGGSFITGYLNSVDKIPLHITQIAYLDANYSYSSQEQHAHKLLEWLNESTANTLTVLAYDDREIELNGKKIVGPTGGTYRVSHRMIEDLRATAAVQEVRIGEFDAWGGLSDRLRILIHPNPNNKILHTRLVGEMNGLIYTIAHGYGAHESESILSRPRKYTKWIQAKPFSPHEWQSGSPSIPRRSTRALFGSAFTEKYSSVSSAQREAAALQELLAGNVPEFMRSFQNVVLVDKDAKGIEHTVSFRVSPDYLSIGSDKDFLRIPITPYTAQLVADAYGCVLPTSKIVDAIYDQAPNKLEPRPLTEYRESLVTFSEHHEIIESQVRNSQGALGTLVAGIKKDVVLSNRLAAQPGRVAIYGWHELDGHPIQPLTTVHIQEYVDYSHGIRLVDPLVKIDGQRMRVEEVLADEQLHVLLSNEGPLATPFYSPAVNAK